VFSHLKAATVDPFCLMAALIRQFNDRLIAAKYRYLRFPPGGGPVFDLMRPVCVCVKRRRDHLIGDVFIRSGESEGKEAQRHLLFSAGRK
jgi:hypothetical protein